MHHNVLLLLLVYRSDISVTAKAKIKAHHGFGDGDQDLYQPSYLPLFPGYDGIINFVLSQTNIHDLTEIGLMAFSLITHDCDNTVSHFLSLKQ